MKSFTSVLNVGALIVAICGSVANAALPPTILWQDNFTGQTLGTGISTLPGWSTISGTSALTSYKIETAYSLASARTFGMNQSAVFGLEQTVTGMSGYTNQWFHFKAHKANGNSATLLDETRVTTSGGAVLYFRIAETQVMALTFNPTADSGLLGDQLSLSAWREFDIQYNNSAGAQTVSFYINNAVVWTTSVSDPGHITNVQFVQQGGAKPATGENHLIGEMRVGTSDCPPPPPPTGINASASPICSGASSTLSVNDPGAGLTTDWFTGSCGGAPVAGGTGTNSVIVSPTTTTTYYARTRNTSTGCVSAACQSVTVTVPNCNDNNACTTDTCSSGTCQNTNVSNGTACEDGSPCTENDTCQGGTCVSGPPVELCDTSNGFDTDWLLVIQSGAYESQVRKLDESKLDCAGNNCVADPPVHNPSQPTDRVYQMDLGTFGGVYSARGQDASFAGKSICFSNSPTPSNAKVPGVNPAVTPAGSRFFGVYEVSDLGEGTGEVTYSRTSFQIVELNSAGQRIRVMQVGLAANIFNDNPDLVHRNANRDLLTAPHWGIDGAPNFETWLFTRNNIDGVEPGTIRYNPAKNTLAVATVVGEFGIEEETLGSVTAHPTEFLMGRDPATKAYPRYRVYEFELPEWEPVYYNANSTWEETPGNFVTVPASWVNEPIPQADPNLVRLVQIYELPGNIQAANGRNQNPYLRPSIDFDNDGNMYCTGYWYSAKHEPCWGLYNGNFRWLGECADDYRGDVVMVNTLGHRAGRNIYHVPVTGPDAANLVVERVAEVALGNTHYFAPTGMTVRRATNELLVVMKNECDCNFTHVFDLNNRIGSGAYPNELVLKRVLSGNLVTGGLDQNTTATCPSSANPFYFKTPRQPYYASYDDVSGRSYFANLFGDCGGVQNFLVLDKPGVASPQDPGPYTVWGDVGYSLTVAPTGTLNTDWDATSPPGTAVNQVGACCLSGNTCQPEMTQTACYDAGGVWQGKGTTTCSPCEGACCLADAHTCEQATASDCADQGGSFSGYGSACDTLCGNSVCPGITCAQPPVDADCDGDVDLNDFAVLQICYNPGGAIPGTPSNCACFDRAGPGAGPPDGVIDDNDVNAFMDCALGSTVPAAPNCP